MKSEAKTPFFLTGILVVMLVFNSLTQQFQISKNAILGNLQSSPINQARNSQILTKNSNFISLENSFLRDRLIKPALTPSKEIYQYKGSITIDIKQNDPQTIEFYASFVEDQNNCGFKKCFIGWISKYKINNEETIQGYPNAQGLQPIFQFDANNDDDIKITFEQNLDQTWKQIIQIACEKFNPIFDSPKKRYSISSSYQPNASSFTLFSAPSARIAPSASIDQSLIRRIKIDPQDKYSATNARIADRQENIKIANIDTRKSKLTQRLQIDPTDNFISYRSQAFQIDLDSETGPDDQDGPEPDLNALIKIQFDLIRKNKDSAGQIQKLKSQFNQPRTKKIAFSRASIESARTAQLKNNLLDIDSDFKEQDNQPTIELIKESFIPGEEIDDITYQKEIRAAQNAQTTITRGSFTDIEGINLKDTFENLDLTTGIRNLQAIPISTTISAGSIAIAKINVLKGTYTILNYLKTLYQRQILGKTVKLQVQVICSLQVFTYYSNVKCTGTLIYMIFGQTKTLNIFQFTRRVNSIWSWSRDYCGNWSFQFKVPLPPPVSFISINFYIGVKYCFKVSLSSTRLSINPYRFKLGALVQTGIETDARASLRVWPLQGGVFIKGTLVKIGTDPSLTFTFLFAQRKLQILISWYFWIIAFNFEWGFFWRYWKLFSGWSGIKIIKKWTINGVYKKYTIIYKTITINL